MWLDQIDTKGIKEIKKLTNDVNNATYFPVFEFLSFEKSKNKEPIRGSKIREDKIGKFISSKIKKVNNAENPNNIMNAYW